MSTTGQDIIALNILSAMHRIFHENERPTMTTDDTKQPIDTGGPAFPMPSGPEPRVNTATHYNEGMTLRDYFAGQVLPIIYAGDMRRLETGAREAYEMADAMLKAREAKP